MAEAEIRTVQRVFGTPPDLYLYLPAEFRNRWEITVGDWIEGVLEQVIKEGQAPTEVGEEVNWPVAGYWNELHIPAEVVDRYGLDRDDRLELLLKAVVSQNLGRGER